MPPAPNPARRGLLLGAAAVGGALVLPARSHAADYPSRPVKVVVGAPPGGPSDFVARLMADTLGPALGQPFVIENKPGGTGVPAADSVAKAPADGHTLLASGPASIAVAPHLLARSPYDPVTDFAPFAILGAGAFVIAVNGAFAARTVQELIQAARARPGEVLYGTGGVGTSQHLGAEMFAAQAGIKLRHIPYKGDGQAVNDLLSGQIQMMFTSPNVAVPHAKTGRLRVLAVTSGERAASLPDVPTVAESGLTGFELLGWVLAFAPAATPRAVLDTLHDAWQKARQQPAIRGRLDDLAMNAPARFNSRAMLGDFVRSEVDRMGRLIRDTGIRADA